MWCFTGKGAIGPKESIEAILAALKKHLTELNSSCLKEITIVTFEQKILDAYGKHFSEWNKVNTQLLTVTFMNNNYQSIF